MGAGFLIGNFFGLGMGFILMMYFSLMGREITLDDLQADPIVNGFFSISGQLIMAALIIFFIYKVEKISLDQVGLTLKKSSIKEFIIGCLVGSFSIVLVFYAYLGLDSLGINLVRKVAWVGIQSFEMVGIILYGLMLFLLVGFQEELLFRGYMISDLSNQKPVVAILIPAVLFSIRHLGNPGFCFFNSEGVFDKRKALITGIALLNIFLVGVILGIYFFFTRDLWLVMGFHFTWNFIQANILGFTVSGLQTPKIIETSLTKKSSYAFLTGGMIGPEGGIIVTFVLLFIGGLLIWYAHRKKIKMPTAIVG